MASTVYLETSIIGYLASRPSRDLITAANQQLTPDWWDEHREQYALYVSETVIAECSVGDPQAADDRLEAIGDIPILDVNPRGPKSAVRGQKPIPISGLWPLTSSANMRKLSRHFVVFLGRAAGLRH
jgi:hypothetical protein